MILAIGDDTTDEDMFEFLQNKSETPPFCIKIGKEKTHAKYSIKEQKFVNLFLTNLLESTLN